MHVQNRFSGARWAHLGIYSRPHRFAGIRCLYPFRGAPGRLRAVVACLAVLALAGCSRGARALDPVVFAPGDQVEFVPVASRVVALTYDDGPDEPYTSALLDVLKQEGAKATFFLIGQNVDAHPEVARRIVAEGHDIGNHTYTHPRLDQMMETNVISELDRAEAAIVKATGIRPTYFRSSFGSLTHTMPALCRQRGYLMVGWSTDGNDWNYRDSKDIADKVLFHLDPGGIILLHDGHEVVDGFDQSRVIEATRTILREAKARGFEVVTVSELLKRYRPSAQEIQFPGGIRYMGMWMNPTTVAAGTDLRCDYYWYYTADARREPYGVAVHFADERGTAFQDDHVLRIDHMKAFEDKLDVPPDLRPGAYQVRLALYRQGEHSWNARLPARSLLPQSRRMVLTSNTLVVTKAGAAP